jgi:hypothetical protein
MLKLMIEAWHIACRDGVPLANIHAALSAIPEYNEMLAEDFKIIEPNVEVKRGAEGSAKDATSPPSLLPSCCASSFEGGGK